MHTEFNGAGSSVLSTYTCTQSQGHKYTQFHRGLSHTYIVTYLAETMMEGFTSSTNCQDRQDIIVCGPS